MAEISHLIRISGDVETTFSAFTSNDHLGKWFTETKCADWEMGANVMWFGDTNMTISEISKNKLVALHVNSGGGWDGTDIRFEVEEINGKSIVRFDQLGWTEITDHFRDCSMSWAYFLESLKQYVETGVGTPEGVAPACEAT